MHSRSMPIRIGYRRKDTINDYETEIQGDICHVNRYVTYKSQIFQILPDRIFRMSALNNAKRVTVQMYM